MSGNGARAATAGTERAAMVSALRRVRGPERPPAAARAPESRCELCGLAIRDEHDHLLHLDERRIVCVCAPCWSLHSGDPEYRPAGSRTLWLEGFRLPDELWAALKIPIGLAFFLRHGATGRVVALYPSPAGATECELELEAWDALVEENPVLAGLEPDAEALLVNRIAEAPEHAIAPIDECYRLVGLVRVSWEGISGGPGVETAVSGFFAELEERAA